MQFSEGLTHLEDVLELSKADLFRSRACNHVARVVCVCKVQLACRYLGQASPLAFVIPPKATSQRFATTSLRSPSPQVLEHKWQHPLQEKPKRHVPSSQALLHDANGGSKGQDHLLEEVAQRSETPGEKEKDRFFRATLVTGYLVDVLRPLLERLGLVIVRSSHGSSKANFAVVRQGALADGAQGIPILCLPVHVRVGHFIKGRGYTIFASVKGFPGLVVLVEGHDGLASSEPVMWDSPAAVYLFAGRSISTETIALTPPTRSKYAPHNLGSYEDLANAVVVFARRVLEEEGPSEDGCGVMIGRTTISVRDLLPLPTLEQMTTPASEAHKRAMEAYVVFFSAKGWLAGPMVQGLLTAEREEGSRSGRFTLTCKLESGAVQLKALGRQGHAGSGGKVRVQTVNGRGTKEPMLLGEVDITVAYTPCLGGCYLIPEFAFAQRGVRKIAGRSLGQVGIVLRPYGGGQEATRAWNMFLVDCNRPEEWVYARCHALLALAAEGKAKGWEAMPPMEELGLASVKMSVPAALAERMFGHNSQQQDCDP